MQYKINMKDKKESSYIYILQLSWPVINKTWYTKFHHILTVVCWQDTLQHYDTVHRLLCWRQGILEKWESGNSVDSFHLENKHHQHQAILAICHNHINTQWAGSRGPSPDAKSQILMDRWFPNISRHIFILCYLLQFVSLANNWRYIIYTYFPFV